MTDGRARLFVALELPTAVRTELVRWTAERLSDLDWLRPVEAEKLHVTLCFLGSQPVDQIPAIADDCKKIASHAGVALALGEALWLPPRRPRLLAVAVPEPGRAAAEPGQALSRLQSALASELERGGWYERERRPFLAHVTVARAAKRARGRPPRGSFPAPTPASFVGTSIALLRSRTGGAESRYERLAAVRLSGPAPASG